jgi:cobalt/nickel transport system ATP-binding protein
MTSAVFELDGVHYGYRNHPALAGVDLVIQPGERLALIGPNGSGKSTLLRLLDALCFASAGRALAFGGALEERRFQDGSVNFAFRRRVGLVFQNPDIQLFNPTVFDEVAFGPLQLGWDRPRIRTAVDEAMGRFEIAHLRDRPPHRLSGGEKKRVALASVLITEPEVLLLDEPTAALDPHSRDRLVHLLSDKAATARTVITATHDLDIVGAIADSAVVMFEGRVLGGGPVKDVLADLDLLHRARLTHTHVHSHAGKPPHAHHHIHMKPSPGLRLPWPGADNRD